MIDRDGSGVVELYAVRIFVRDWPAACRFYGDVLGLPERFRDDTAGWTEYDLGGPCFGIERVESGDPDGDALVGRFVGISLKADDIDRAWRDLTQKGVVFTEPPEQQPWGGSLAHFQDSDGNILTLVG